MAGDIGSLLLLLAAMGAVFWVMLRPPTAGQRSRRRLLVDGRGRDVDPVLRAFAGSPLPLLLLAVLDLFGELGSTGGVALETAFAVGAALAVCVRVPGVAGSVVFLVGAAALGVSVWELLVGDGYDRIPDGTARVVVIAGAGIFLLVVAALRLVFAPLRASGAEAAGAFLAVYGVLQAMIAAGHLWLSGVLSGVSLPQVFVAVAALGVVALGIAVIPQFTTVALGVGLTVLAFTLAAEGIVIARGVGAVTLLPLAAAVAGAAVVYAVGARLSARTR